VVGIAIAVVANTGRTPFTIFGASHRQFAFLGRGAGIPIAIPGSPVPRIPICARSSSASSTHSASPPSASCEEPCSVP
jgi:hypothetical protein